MRLEHTRPPHAYHARQGSDVVKQRNPIDPPLPGKDGHAEKNDPTVQVPKGALQEMASVGLPLVGSERKGRGTQEEGTM